VTQLTPYERCVTCRGVLVPPVVARRVFTPPLDADYVCLNCGRPYRWIGSPPRLTLLAMVERLQLDQEEEDE